MPRRPRIDLPGFPLHVVQRGNNRQPCFFGDGDRYRYLRLLAEYASERHVAVHAYVLMTNHVHLLLTPTQPGGVSALMQDLGRAYVSAINAAHERTGSLWEGRFHACIVETDSYALTCMRYIELNPVRAGMVALAQDYRWSSHCANALGLHESPLTPASWYLALGTSTEERAAAYRNFVSDGERPTDVNAIRAHTRQAAAWGSDEFRAAVEAALGRRVALVPRGRPSRQGNPEHGEVQKRPAASNAS